MIALAATLAFVLQRARYFREVEPAVSIGQKSSGYASLKHNMRFNDGNEIETGSRVEVQVPVHNTSQNHLRHLRLEKSELTIIQSGKTYYNTPRDKYDYGSLLPGQQQPISHTIAIVPSIEQPKFQIDAPGVQWQWEGVLAFSPRRDAALVFMNPWSWGSITFRIAFSIVWEWYTPNPASSETLPRQIGVSYNHH